MRPVLLLTFLLAWPAHSASATTLLVSDIDDTVKISHVHNKLDHGLAALCDSNVFAGMPELLQFIKLRIPDLVVAYVTNAASSVTHKTHRALIAKNGFPDGEIYFRSSKKDHEHKLRVMRKLPFLTVKNRLFRRLKSLTI